MKKILLTALIAGFSTASLAQVSMYGLADTYFGTTKNATSTTKIDSGGMSTSHIGFKATEKLGDITATAALETFLRPDTASTGRFNGDAFYARNAYVGLSSKAGEVQLGRVTTPMFISTVAFNSFGDSFTFSPIVTTRFGLSNFNLAAGGTDSGWNNSILARTNMGPVAITGVYSAGITDDTSGTTQSGKSIGAMMFQGPIGLTATWQEVEQGAGRPNMSATIVGASYAINNAKLFAQYNRVQNSDTATKEDQGYSVGASIKLSNVNTAMISYSKHEHTFMAAPQAETSSWAVGVQHSMSKRTDVYAAVRDTSYTHAGWTDTKVMGAGIRHRF